ncbi:MAG: helix-turn-helix transcriptional regulator [Reichenbachiella sp.]|uniref:helix-turn-helix domain-containing protein n=1 Tax=Reichenbachiella sp. TaxID=2184521 RepID=UPI0029675E06|nr:helix-turn-helix transcriptional regulator [Reichenbachiella sp.]MDW3209516.1 helix-turn-helix transcriptional regulator [Reichenbachiella sp.]
MSFGLLLREARSLKRISRKELAERSGVSYVQLTKYEDEKAQPTYPVIEKIIKALGLPRGYFFYNKEYYQELDAVIESKVGRWQQLKPYKKTEFLLLIDSFFGNCEKTHLIDQLKESEAPSWEY